MQAHELVEVESHDDGVVVVRLNRPTALNALSQALMSQLADTLEDVQRMPGVRGVVLSSTSPRAFCVGADTKEIATLSRQQFIVANRRGGEVFQRIEDLPFPVAAAVNGYALGGGFELALACDARFASEGATFGLPEVSIGFIPGWGGIRRLSSAIGVARAKRIVLTGERLTAAQASELGIVEHPIVADPDAAAVEFIRSIPEGRQRSIAITKHMFSRIVNEPGSANLETLYMSELLTEDTYDV
ncbi:enoyl-CoA hydratase/isomerase family protein [Cryobacterium sp. Hh7]|uniref:enoyl-CoA hydratase/isomerase family protein n=1 Tax=Cryobacterium sp. Hh7 TaxID=1259159 RepID=UPI00106ADD76|nr:enoyl-CoA hydratase/isomerase family protein [Cryobacterium sp. Hh7]TFD50724.1 enoyl-CoA hydratase/isomerase family protein [Cryobacterium sp. Hh7]